MSPEQGMETIRQAVAESLALPVEDVRPESRLITDLGADSLDFLDLIFTFEKKFGVKLREGRLDFLSRLDVSKPGTLAGEFLTMEAVHDLTPYLPGLSDVEDPARVTPARLFSFITVETLWRLVDSARSEHARDRS